MDRETRATEILKKLVELNPAPSAPSWGGLRSSTGTTNINWYDNWVPSVPITFTITGVAVGGPVQYNPITVADLEKTMYANAKKIEAEIEALERELETLDD